MKSLKTLILAAVMLTAVLVNFETVAQTTLGDSPGVFAFTAGTITNGNTSSTTYTNNGANLGNAYLLVAVTNTAGTSPTLTSTLMSSTDNSTWTLLSQTASVTTNYAATGQGAIAITLVGPIQNYGYLRVTNTLTGTTPAYNGSVSLIMPAKYR